MHDHTQSFKQRQAGKVDTAVNNHVFVESMDVVRSALPGLPFGPIFTQYQTTALVQERRESYKHVIGALADAWSVGDLIIKDYIIDEHVPMAAEKIVIYDNAEVVEELEVVGLVSI